MKKPNRPGNDWLSWDEVGAALSRDPRQVQNLVKDLMVPESALCRGGKRIYWIHCRTLIDLMVAKEVRANASDEALTGKYPDEERALLIERHRKLKLENDQKERILLPRSEVHECFGRMGGLLRRAGEQLQKRFGREAHSLLDVALRSMEREAKSAIGGQ